MKQLEYSWLRSMMGRYQDFGVVTREALSFTLGVAGRHADAATVDAIVSAYDRLAPYPEARATLVALAGVKRAILSNGSPGMLRALVRHAGIDGLLEAVISVDAAQAFKPDPRAYALVEQELGVRPDETLFVSSNGFDVSGAKSFGFTVARIERVTRDAMRVALADPRLIDTSSIFKALRSQLEAIGHAPDFTVEDLSGLPALAAAAR
jgi:2-haloacid dehalogenase